MPVGGVCTSAVARCCVCECGLGPYQNPSIYYVCVTTHPRSQPHRISCSQLCGRVLRLCCPNPRHATSAPVAPVRPAPLLAITYLLTTHDHGSRAHLLP